MKIFDKLKFAFGGVLFATLAACGGGGGTTASEAESGTLRIALTDAPSCGYDTVNITVEKVRVHQSSTASDSDSGWSEVLLNPSRRVNLLDLTNGVLEELGQTPLPAGKYTQLRMILAENNTANPLANSVKPTGFAEVALRTPSGQQSGVKTSINIDIASGKLADFVLDFDACKSIVSAGNSGQYLLKPVVTVIPRYVSAVLGFVDLTLVGAGTSVSVQQNSAVIKSTTPDSTGKFLLQPVAPGSYTLVLVVPGRTTAIITNVVVITDTVTSVNASGTALNPPLSATGMVNGTSTLNSYVRAVQTLSSETQAEVIGRFVDASTGAYSYALPVSAPLVAPYVAAPGVLVFTADASAAGKYSVKAGLTGFVEKTAILSTLTDGSIIMTNFTFP